MRTAIRSTMLSYTTGRYPQFILKITRRIRRRKRKRLSNQYSYIIALFYFCILHLIVLKISGRAKEGKRIRTMVHQLVHRRYRCGE